MHTDRHIGIRQILGPAAAVALIAGGIVLRPDGAPSSSAEAGSWLERGGGAVLGALLDPPEELEGDFSKPLGWTVRSGDAGGVAGPGGTSRMMLVQSGQEGTYEIVVEDGKISAKVDGEPLADERILREGDTVKLLDENGDVLTTFTVGRKSGLVGVFGQPRDIVVRELPDLPRGRVIAGPGSQPKVMVGVTMTDAPRELLEYFEVDAPHGIVLDRVYDGLPASKAGLKARDIIVSIDGSDGATQESLRSLLREKGPGDEVKVKVLRKGEVKSFTIELAPYKPEALGIRSAGPGGVVRGFNFEELGKAGSEEARKAIEEAMKALGSIDQEEIAAQARKSLELALKQLEGFDEGQWRDKLGDMDFEFELQPRMRFFTDKEGQQMFMMPRNFGGTWNQTESRLERLDERLRALEQKLERLEGAIDRMGEDG